MANDPSTMINLPTKKGEDCDMLSGYLKEEYEMGESLKRRQDAMEAKLQKELQHIVEHLKRNRG